MPVGSGGGVHSVGVMGGGGGGKKIDILASGKTDYYYCKIKPRPCLSRSYSHH